MADLSKLKFSIHQINTVTGDLDGNTEKIKKLIEEDHKEECDLSIFPETAISGYMCGSLWDRVDFVQEQMEKIYEIHSFVQNIGYKGTVVVGAISYTKTKKNGFPELYNSAYVITRYKRELHGVRRTSKQLLASADHHEDRKYFKPGWTPNLAFRLSTNSGEDITFGIAICEDLWADDHDTNVAQELVDSGAELIIHINQSYFYYGKQQKRIDQFSKISKEVGVPIISVNSVGVGDIVKNIVVFDGGSMIINEKGELVWYAPQFREYHYSNTLGWLLERPLQHNGTKPKYKEIIDALVYEQQEYFKLIGIEKAQVHVSGGLDSAVTAALMVKAMGKENVILISNPSLLNTTSCDYVYHLEEKLGVPVIWQGIQELVDKFREIAPEGGWNKGAQTAIHAVLRSVIGLADTHQFKSSIVATGNHTEIVLGWANFHDIGSIGAHAPLADLTKVEIYELAEAINEMYVDEVIPKDLFDGKFAPAAELPDAMEDPIDYWVQSGICAGLIRERMSKKDLNVVYSEIKKDPSHHRWMDLFPASVHVVKYSRKEWENQVDFAIKSMKRSVFKAAQAPPNVIISPRSRGFSNRETLINKYNK